MPRAATSPPPRFESDEAGVAGDDRVPRGGHTGCGPRRDPAPSAAVNEAREFTARVPNERETLTVKVKILFPPPVAVFAFAPSPGWARQELKTRDGRLRGVVQSVGKIGAGEYADFGFLGTPLREGTAVWKSEQTYADGVTKPWTGPPEKDGETAQETGPSAAGGGGGDPARPGVRGCAGRRPRWIVRRLLLCRHLAGP